MLPPPLGPSGGDKERKPLNPSDLREGTLLEKGVSSGALSSRGWAHTRIPLFFLPPALLHGGRDQHGRGIAPHPSEKNAPSIGAALGQSRLCAGGGRRMRTEAASNQACPEHDLTPRDAQGVWTRREEHVVEGVSGSDTRSASHSPHIIVPTHAPDQIRKVRAVSSPLVPRLGTVSPTAVPPTCPCTPEKMR